MTPPTSSERRYDLDWLRVIAFGILMFFHTGMGFDSFDWHVKNYESSPLIDELVNFIHQWRMPLLFFISGAAVWFALEKYGAWHYFAERQKRLLLPLVFGILVVIPPQVYCERVYQRMGYASFFDFYRTLFTSGPYPQGNLSWHHLWYIPYIWAFSMVTLPLFLWLKSATGRRWVEWFQKLLARGGWIYLLFAPSALAEIALRPYYPGDSNSLFSDWANFAHKLTFFVLGYALASGSQLASVVAVRRYRYLAAALASLVAVECVWKRVFPCPPPVYRCLSNFHIWMWLLAALGFGRRYLNINPPALRYCTNAVYPFYILHQTVIIMLLLPLVPVDLGLWTKYLLVLTGTVAVTWGLYAGLISRVNLLRLCFGLKANPARKASRAAPALALMLITAVSNQAESGQLKPALVPAPSLSQNRLGIPDTQPAAVYLPPSYETSGKHYPVIYLLPNFQTPVWRYTAGGYQGFRVRDAADRLARAGTIPELIVVIPNASHFLGSSWFRNSTLTGNWEDFLTHDLLGYVDSRFRTIPRPEGRAVAGHGVGGTGALEIGLKHPELFCALYAMSPAIFVGHDLEELTQGGDAQSTTWRELKTSWNALDKPNADRAFRLYMQARLYGASRNDLFDALRLSCAAAVCQPTLAFPGIDWPSPETSDVATRLRFWGDILGNWDAKIAAYKTKARPLKSVTVERGQSGDFDFIVRGTDQLFQLLHSAGVPSQLILGEGGHDSFLGRRLENGMLPTLGKSLAGE